jgi:two-component system cell cycle response regulator DivK
MSRTLEEAGYEVVRAFGAKDALRRIKMKAPDLILTDLAMPQVSGAQLIRVIKADPELRHIPCVAVTAHTYEGVGQLARQAGCDGFVSKPFRPARLLEEVVKHLGDPDWTLPSQ